MKTSIQVWEFFGYRWVVEITESETGCKGKAFYGGLKMYESAAQHEPAVIMLLMAQIKQGKIYEMNI